MADTYTVNATFGYTGTDFTRTYQFGGVSIGALSSIVANVKSLNASLEAGTSGGLDSFFIADDYDATDSENIIGKFAGIVALQSQKIEDTDIDLNS